jgi:hypothetical protein
MDHLNPADTFKPYVRANESAEDRDPVGNGDNKTSHSIQNLNYTGSL